MEIIKPIFFIFTGIIIIFLLFYWIKDVESKRKWKWYEHLIIMFTTIIFTSNLFTGIMLCSFIGEDNSIENTYEYHQGYKDALDTKFEQRIDTVYIKKK
jgi:hypothetical protein